MAKAYGKLMVLSADEAARLRAEAHAKWVWDDNSRMRQSHREGLEQGLKKGLKKGLMEGEAKARVEMVRQMLEMRMPIDIIAKATGLPEAEIEQLSKNRQN